MGMLEIEVVRGKHISYGYTCISDNAVPLIVEFCGCKPSKWDGCKALDVAVQLQKGVITATESGGLDLGDKEGLFDDTFDFLLRSFHLCRGHSKARVEVRIE